MNTFISEYARLTVRSGVNLQKGQTLLVNASIHAVEFTHEVVKQAYLAGAKEVLVTYEDEILHQQMYTYQSEETLKEIHQWQIDSKLDYLKEGACRLHIISPLPGILKDCDPKKMNAHHQALSQASKEIREYTMSSKVQWSIVAVPNATWAMQVFPHLSQEDAMAELWRQILQCVYVEDDKDAVITWKNRDETFHNRITKLNAFGCKQLHFTNELGTDLYVGLVDDHIWGGGSEEAQNGVIFHANIPTEEVFTMPHHSRVHGHVVASRPLLYNGNIIKDFSITFQDGKVTDFDAKEGKHILEQLIRFDDGSCRLGEVALVPHDSGISQSGMLFYTTLFDENASCHLALGQTYPSCVKNGLEMDEDALYAIGGNTSLVHEDFMFGTKDMCIKGELADGTWIPIFKNGNFVI